MKQFLGLAALAACVSHTFALFPDCKNGPLKNNLVCNPSASVQDRARALVKALKTAEKFTLTGHQSPGVARLGIPEYPWWNEALHGVASSPGVNFSSNGDFSYATSFPQPITMSAAFDDQLILNVATVVSTEARAFNNANRSGLDFWTPNINPYKDPRWGRGQETPGEDPYHISNYVKNLISGLQGGHDPKIKKIVATCKHFVAYDVESWEGNYRYQFNAVIDQQDLSSYYMQPFKACARDSNVGSIMCSYNALNGVPTCADPYILQTVLREHWNWTNEEQYVTSDCDAIQNVYMPHDYATTPEQAVADTLKAGADLNCGTYYQTHLPNAFAQGLFDESVIDTALTRLFSAQIKLGYFDPASATPYRSLGWSDVSTSSSLNLARQAAVEGMALLKNDGTLPLKVGSGKKMNIALIGSWANATTQMQGSYAGIAKYLHSPLYAAQQLPNVNILFANGVGGQGDPTTDDWVSALTAGAQADVIIVADGISDSDESEGMDRYSIDWTGAQTDMLYELASMGKPTILLQFGDQLDDTPFLDHPNISAIVWGGYPGMAGGDAVMDIVTGAVAPAGRLPVTQYPKNYVKQVPMTDMSLKPNLTSGNPGRTYQFYPEASAVLPFGYGLHYTNFSTSIAGIKAADGSTGKSLNMTSIQSHCDRALYPYLDACPLATVSVNVQNTGNAASDFVALMFLAPSNSSATSSTLSFPNKRLVSYTRVHGIMPGKMVTASMNMTMASIASYDDNGDAVIVPGNYDVVVDVPTADSMGISVTGVSDQNLIVEQWPRPPMR